MTLYQYGWVVVETSLSGARCFRCLIEQMFDNTYKKSKGF